MKVNGFKIILMISNLCSIDVISMTYLYSFGLLIMQINLESTFHLNSDVCRKKTFSCVYTNLKSFIPETYKIGLIKSLLFRCFSLFSDFIKIHYEIDKLKSILYKNSYPHNLVDKYIKEFLDKILASKSVVSTLPKKNLAIALPRLGKLSLQISHNEK